MVKKLFLAFILCLSLPVAGLGADLYKVYIQGQADAEKLIASGAEAVIRVSDGYLALADSAAAERLSTSGLKTELVASGLDKTLLALDNSPRPSADKRYQVVFQEEQIRLLRVDGPQSLLRDDGSYLIPLRDEPLAVRYKVPLNLNPAAAIQADSLVDLIGLISQDSLVSYLSRLQAFNGRVAGTSGNYAARDWIRSKFQSFGYTNVTLDPFMAYVYTGDKTCYNVVCKKTGSVYPNRQVIVGAHFDGVPSSPGADDNGTGTAAVLEIARALFGKTTEMTFIFVLFDSEEQGLNGSYHYAYEAASRQDSIICMVNMDMIGNQGNTNLADLHYGAENAYAKLWSQLGDSLVGILGLLSGGSSNTDHYPFTQYGYDVVSSIEHIFSSVYHTPQDSTTHVSYDYFTRMVQASLATAFTIDRAPLPVEITSVRDGGDGQSLQVTWHSKDPAHVTFYRVYFDTEPSTRLDSITVSSGVTSILLTGLTNGQVYRMYVTAFDTHGHSSTVFSEALGTPHIKPAPPQGLIALPRYRAIRLNWVANNTELDFSHYRIIRDDTPLPDAVTDSFYIDDDFNLGSSFHSYLVVAVDADNNISDTGGVQPQASRAATLEPGRILAVNRSSKTSSSIVNEIVTGQFLREALTGYTFDYFSDTAWGSINRTDTLHLNDLLDYEVLVIGGESGRGDDLGNEAIFGGFLDTLDYFLSIGGKAVIFGRWGDLYSGGTHLTDTDVYQPGASDYGYRSLFHINSRVKYLTSYSSNTLTSDLIGAHTLAAGYPELTWDSLAAVNHSAPWTIATGIPCPSFANLTATPEVIYTYNSRSHFVLTDGKPIAWRYHGSDYQYVFFNIPLSFINRAQAVAALRLGVSELISAGWGASTAIAPDTIDSQHNPPAEVSIYLGDFISGKAAADVDLSTIMINGSLAPGATAILPSYPPFSGQVLQIQVPTTAFLATYGIVVDTVSDTYAVSFKFTGDAKTNIITGPVTLIGQSYLPGDANGDGLVNIGDAVSIVNYVFKGGPTPNPPEAGDANCDRAINVGDAVYIINFIFKGGPAPGCH